MNKSPAKKSNNVIKNFAQLRNSLKKLIEKNRPLRVALVVSQEKNALRAISDLYKEGCIEPVLIGDISYTKFLADGEYIDISKFNNINVPDPIEACITATKMAANNEIDIIFRGRIPAYDILHILLKEEYGLRQKHDFWTHITVFEIPNHEKLLFLSDAGIIINPDIEAKIKIIQQAIKVSNTFGIVKPRVALLAAVETVTPKMSIGMEEAAIAKMGERGQIGNAFIDGPLAFDVAVSQEAANLKKVGGEVAGKADIIIAPHIEAGNTIYKALVIFSNAKAGAAIIGGKVPIIITSRSDTHANRINSIIFASWLKFKM